MPVRIVPIPPQNGHNEFALCRDGPMLYNRHDTDIGASLREHGEWSRAGIMKGRRQRPRRCGH